MAKDFKNCANVANFLPHLVTLIGRNTMSEYHPYSHIRVNPYSIAPFQYKKVQNEINKSFDFEP